MQHEHGSGPFRRLLVQCLVVFQERERGPVRVRIIGFVPGTGN